MQPRATPAIGRALAVALTVGAAMGVAGCGSHAAATSTGPPAGGPAAGTSSSGASSPATGRSALAGGCTLPTTPQLIERTVSPTGPPVAVLVGAANTVLCQPTTQAFRAGVPSGPGWCTQLARFDDNPGYDVNQVPAPPLQKVIASAGAGC
ncbi:MAG TPA: hypothetical protein VFP61_02810 [Acidimicrobiales bacterium]|nr:hypothetical protein [Acidimicrobiales bacterium]